MSDFDNVESAYLTSDEMIKEKKDLEQSEFRSGLRVFRDHNGFRKGELHTFIGTKGSGKSTWSKTINSEIVYNNKSVLLYISEENRAKYVYSINASMRLMKKSEEQIKDYLENIIVVSELDEKMTTPQEFFDHVRYLIKTLELDIFILDNFTTSFLSELPINIQSKVLRDLKKLADELDIPILVFFHTGKLKKGSELDGDNVRGSGTGVNIGSYNYLIVQIGSGDGLRNFVFTEKARYHSKANKQMYEMKYDHRVGMFVGCEKFSMEAFQELKNPKKKSKSWQ